jgi:beta-lactamase class A
VNKSCFIVAFLLGTISVVAVQQTGWTSKHCTSTYSLINPANRCTTAIEQGEWDYEPLRDELLMKKEEWKTKGQVSHISIYFRDLDHGPRFGIGEYDKFQPASLIKLPVLIAFLHEADRDPSILEKKLSYSDELKVNENVDESWQTIQPNIEYSIRELLEKMIVYSDNYSYLLLTREMNSTPSITAYYTFRDLGILRMMQAPNADYISIQNYSNLFAVLYNTGYLSKDMSQLALELLSESTFKDGLVAGVPKNVRVAHKFGHRILADADSQLHDCGIVYHPDMAYLLCVMTSGPNMEAEQYAIAEVSRMVYDAVSSIRSVTFHM